MLALPNLNEIGVHGFDETLLVKLWMNDGRRLSVPAQDPGRLDNHLQLFVPRERPDVVDDALEKKKKHPQQLIRQILSKSDIVKQSFW